MTSPKRSNLPTIISSIAPDLRRFLDRIKELLDSPQGVVTKEDLVNTGAFKNSTAGTLSLTTRGVSTGTISLASAVPISCIAPPPPTDLSASGAMTSIFLSWKGVNYGVCYAYTEIWRSSGNDIGDTVLLGTTESYIYTDAVGSDASNYYWVRLQVFWERPPPM